MGVGQKVDRRTEPTVPVLRVISSTSKNNNGITNAILRFTMDLGRYGFLEIGNPRADFWKSMMCKTIQYRRDTEVPQTCIIARLTDLLLY